jgi:hypothetical protein
MLQQLIPRKLHIKSKVQACPSARPQQLRPQDQNARLQRLNCLPVSAIATGFTLPAHASPPLTCRALSDQTRFFVIQNP